MAGIGKQQRRLLSLMREHGHILSFTQDNDHRTRLCVLESADRADQIELVPLARFQTIIHLPGIDVRTERPSLNVDVTILKLICQ